MQVLRKLSWKNILTVLYCFPQNFVLKGAIRAAEHFRESWIARSQISSSIGPLLSLSSVEEMIELGLRILSQQVEILEVMRANWI